MKEKIGVHYKYLMDMLDRWNDRMYYIVFVYLKVIMDIFFVVVASQIYQYHYYEVHGNAIKYILSWVIYLVLVVLMPKKENSIKTFFLHIQLLIMVLPMLTLYAFTENRSTIYILQVSMAIVLEILVLKEGKKEYKPVRIKNLKAFVSTFMLFLIPLITVLTINYGGFSGFSAFNAEVLNNIRANASYPALLSYLIMWCIHIFIPFYIVYCLEKKHYVLAAFLVFDDIVLYMVLAQKIIYLSLAVILVVYALSKTGHFIKLMHLAVCVGLTAMIILFLVEKSDVSMLIIICVSLLGDRFLFQPALNKFLYYDIFSQYPKLYFSDGMIGKCMGLTNIYKYEPGQLAFGYVWNGRYGESNSCTGYLGDGYAQLGFIGIIIGAVVLALLVKYIDHYCDNIAFGILAAIMALYVVMLNDGALQTVLLSGGLFIFLIFLAIYTEVNKADRKGLK